ncbi:MAG: NAD-dependent epimerase/dehydratase family protein, partial [Thermotogae bacterium]|nr:NAD-dependent epimerase/dehydratase family protein [Thermotogota bacterium]
DADINIIGTLNLLILSKKYGVEKFIFSSSGGVMYGETPPVFPTPEDVPADPISPYGISKYSAERYIIFFHREHGLGYTILRYSNVYGPKQNPYGEAGVVAIFTTRMLKDQDVEIYGDGENIRDYVFVGDVVNANILAMEKADGEILNIGTGKGTTVNELFEILKNMTGYNREAKHVAPRPGDLRKSVLDWSNAKEKLGWSPKYKLEDGLKLTVEWFRENLP